MKIGLKINRLDNHSLTLYIAPRKSNLLLLEKLKMKLHQKI